MMNAAAAASAGAPAGPMPGRSAGRSDQSAAPAAAPMSPHDPHDAMDDFDDSEGEDGQRDKRHGRRKIRIEFIEDRSRRHITFSKRKAGIMKKAYELSTLTGTQVLLLVASETGHVYTFATPKLQPLITKPEGKNLIQACLNAPDHLSDMMPGLTDSPRADHQGGDYLPQDYDPSGQNDKAGGLGQLPPGPAAYGLAYGQPSPYGTPYLGGAPGYPGYPGLPTPSGLKMPPHLAQSLYGPSQGGPGAPGFWPTASSASVQGQGPLGPNGASLLGTSQPSSATGSPASSANMVLPSNPNNNNGAPGMQGMSGSPSGTPEMRNSLRSGQDQGPSVVGYDGSHLSNQL